MSHGKPCPELLGLEDEDPSENAKQSLGRFLSLISIDEFLEITGKSGKKLGIS